MPTGDPHDRLESWKAIAGYLQRTERTARRWERLEGLPVHRLPHHDRSSVYAYKSELDAWRTARRIDHPPDGDANARLRNSRRAWFAVVAAFVAFGAVLAGYFTWRAARPPSVPTVTLAVLPFAMDSPPEETEHLGPAVAETLVNHLAAASDLRVRPFATSLRHYRRADEPVDIGERMGVDVIVAGHVDASGEDLAIKVALVDVETNAQIWGESIATTYGGLGRLQKRIATRVREEVLRHRHGVDFAIAPFQTAGPLSSNPAAVRHYLRGLGYWRNPGSSQISSSIDQFRVAVELDPDFAAAHANLSVAYVAYSFFSEMPAAALMQPAKAHAQKSIALDPRAAEGHMALAGVSHWYDFDHGLAEEQFRAAIAAAPGQASVRNWYAEFLLDMRRFDEAFAANRAAAELDPGWLLADLVEGNIFLYSGRPEASTAIYEGMLKVEPSHGLAHYFHAQAQLALGRHSAALAALKRANEAMGNPPFAMAALAHCLARAGRRSEAEAMLRDFEQRRAAKHYPAFALAMAHVGLGNDGQAIEWLERAADERAFGYYLPSVERAWDPLRGHPAFQRLLNRLGLEQSTS